MTQTYRILEIDITDFKKVKAVRFAPDPTWQIIAGDNAAGKTSVLDAIWAALCGRHGKQEKPVRDGQSRAEVRLDLGELIVTRTWGTKGGMGTLSVTTPEGSKYSDGQKVLDQLYGKLGFDLTGFLLAKPTSQRQQLLEVVDLPFDPDELERRRQGAYSRRTEANARVRQFRTLLEQLPKPEPDIPIEEKDLAEARARWRRTIEVENRIKEIKTEFARLEARMEELRVEGSDLWNVQRQIGTEAAAAKELTDLDAFNAKVRAKREYERVRGDLREAVAGASALDHEIDSIDVEKVQGLANAKLPVDGLGFTEDGVTLNGVPFTQASAAERIRAAVGIAMAGNPALRVLRVTDASLLDAASLQILHDMAVEHDFQVWVERVGPAGAEGITIVDGEIP
jgi:hypothetical protein